MMYKADLDGWVKAGNIGIDAGICWIGDPCYILIDKDEKRAPELGKNWSEFCDLLGEDYPTAKQIGKGTGVVVSTGFGDGLYDVYVRYSNEGSWGKRVAEVKVVFIGDGDDSDDYNENED